MTIERFKLRLFLRVTAIVIGVVAWLSTGNVSAQTTTGTVKGTITAGGAPVVGAQVTLRNPATGVSRTTTTRDDGQYVMPGVVPATYQMSVRRIGNEPQARTVTVQIGATQVQDFSLTTQATELSAIVVQAAGVETRTSESATNVTAAQIEKLPTPSRNFLDLAQLSPGVTVTEDRVNGQFRTVQAGGQSSSAVNLFIDGTSFKNDLTQGGIAGQDASRGNPFPRNAVQEYRVISQNFKAEYQKATSAVITATTKAGTNTWTGNALFGFQNKGMVALDSFQRADKANNSSFTKPDYKRTLAALSVGGPIMKDKLFFFGSYEGNYQDRNNRVAIPAIQSGVFPALDTVNLNQYNGTFGSPFRETLLFGKLTDQLSENSTAELSISNRHETDVRDFGGNNTFSTANNVHNYNTAVQAKHTLVSGAWLNEALLSYSHFHRGFSPNSPGTAHRVFILPTACCFEVGSGRSTQEYIQKGPAFRDDITYTGFQAAGEHVFKGGVSLDFPTYDINKNNDATPVFEYQNIRNVGFGDQVYNYASPFQLRYGTGDPMLKSSNKKFGVYLQDDWSPIQRLTFNIGVRWDYETNMLNTDYVTPKQAADTLTRYASNLIRPLDLSRYIATGNNRKPFAGAFQPRLGFSYSVDRAGRTTVFGGWGLYYDRVPFDVAVDEKQKITHPTYFTLFAPRGQAPIGTEIAWNDSYLTADKATLDAVSKASGRPELWLIDNDFKIPKTTQYSFGLRQVLGDFSGTVSYASQTGTDQFTLNLANVALNPGGGCCRNPFNWADHGYSNIIYSSNEAKTWYHAVNVQLERAYKRVAVNTFGWGAGLALTFARRWLQGVDNLGDTFAFPSASEIPKHAAPNDEKTRIVGNWIMDVPYLFGIQWSGLATFGGQYRIDAGCSRFCSSGDVANNPRLVGGFSPDATFPYQNVDMRLRKDFPRFGRSNLALGITLDVFNVLNHDNLGCYNVGNPKDANYGKAGCTVTDARRYQVGAEVNW